MNEFNIKNGFISKDNSIVQGSLNATSISATTYYNLPTNSSFTGGTVTGATIFTNGLTANTFNATSINTVDYIVFNTGTTSAATVPGTVYFDNTEYALSYNTSINQGVTVNLGQQNYVRVFNNSGTDIQRGKALELLTAYSGLPAVTLAINRLNGANIIGVSAEVIPNNAEGIAITNGIISNITLTGMSVGSLIYASDTIPGELDDATKYLNFPLTARTNQIGYVIQTGVTTGKMFLNINNENTVLSLTDLQRNVLEGNVISTGVFEFSGITLSTGNTFNISNAKGFIVDNTTNPLKPEAKYIEYSGQTGLTTPYLLTDTITYVLINSSATITLLNTFPTPQQRRENIYLGKLGHANKTSIINVFNEADFDISPIAQLRDMFTPIKLINSGVVASPNGANLNINTSSGIIWGMGIGFTTNQLNPNSFSISGASPTTFQYRTQTGGTASNTTTIIPGNYDLNGVVTAIGAPAKQATNQRIYLTQNGQFRIQYGQTVYGDLTLAVAAAQVETFNTFSNFKDNAILIGILSTRSDTTNLSDPLYAKFLFVSKFGELGGGTGGLSTTNLQQAYNNSSNPEIIINSTLDGLTIQNGTGNADNITRLLEGSNAAGNVTSFIRADGYISGTTFQTNGTFLNNGGITATTVSATTYLNLPTSGGGTFTGGTVTGATTFTNGLTANTISATTYFNLPLDVYVTGSTLNPANYDFTLTRNDGVTITSNLGILSSDMTVTGGTYDINTGVVTFTNNSGATFNVTGFTSGMTDTFTTGGTVSSGIATFTKSDGSTYSVSGFSVGNEYWSSGTGLNSVIQTGSNSLAGGEGALAGGSGNSANSKYSIALGINSIANGSEILPVKTPITVVSGITITSSDPNYGLPSVVFFGVDVSIEWYDYFYGPYGSENSFVIDDGVGNTHTLYDYNLTNIYFDSTDTYIVDGNIPLTSYITISGSPYYNVPTIFQAPAFVFGSNSLVTGGNSIVLGSNISGTSDNTTYVDYFNIKRFINNNIIFGGNAGYGVTGVSNSNFFGQNAGEYATSANDSNFIGEYAGSNAINANNSNFMGYVAGIGATNANNSNFFGTQAGDNAINAYQSNFMGILAGQAATNASQSNFFGPSAGYSATGASQSNFFGPGAGQFARNANNSNFFGNSAGYQATGAANSNFFGTSAGQDARNAFQSNFFGSNAGYDATSANRSNFFGVNAGNGATDADNSNFIGRSAGYQAISAYYSNFIGYAAGSSATGASNSNFMGSEAGNNAINAYQSNFLGYQSGLNANSASNSNLFGYRAGYSFTNNNIGSNNIIIGTNISLPSGTTNSINLGGVLFGKNTYATTGGNPSISAQITGRIGINVVNPSEALDVSGNTLINGNLTANTILATTYYNLPTDITITGGTYSAGTAVFNNNTGGTFSITGFSTSTGSGTFTGGTVTGSTTFTNGLTANIFSATTYQNLPEDIRVTGGTYSSGTAIFTNNTGGTFSVSGFSTSTGGGTFTGGTVNGETIFTNGLSANTISATTYLNLPPSTFSGGTVTGPTTFTNGLTANTFSATTIEGGDLDFMMVSLFRTLYNY